ncbi:MAG: signal peptidase II [Anaerolineae bacterium]|nr:signal peptidase II [Gemmatimonadaceae bacterium]
MERSRRKQLTFWSLAAVVVCLDACTKAIAVERLPPVHVPREVFGDFIRFTLVYNPGAAFGLNVGPYSRWVFLVLTIVALFILSRLYRAAHPNDTLRTIALGLVCGGAVGNLLDRIRSASGVVDFLDVGVGGWRWPTFNVADIAVSIGAFLLAWSLWGEEETSVPAAAQVPVPTTNPGQGT